MKKFRVGVVTTSFPVSENSTSGIFIRRLVSHMPAGVDVTVLTPCSAGHDINQSLETCRVTCFAYGPRAWMRLAHRPGGIPDAIRRLDPALLLLPLLMPAMFFACLRLAGKVDIMHGNWSIPAVVSALAARIRGIPSLATLRGEDMNRADDSWLFRQSLKTCLVLNAYTVVVSEAMRDKLQKKYPRYASKVKFIPNGVASISSVNRPPFRSPLRLVTVSSLIHRKRIDTLIHAVSILKGEINVILRIVGDGRERESLKKIAKKLGIEGRVEFAGEVPPAAVEDQLLWGDVFILCSESEGRPNVILEAMAAELPVLATDIPGAQELLSPDKGLLFPVGDVHALSQCISKLFSDPDEARQMADRGRKMIESNGLTWEASAQSYCDLYEDAIKTLSGNP